MAGWTDYCANWTQDGIKLHPFFNLLTALTLAINERCQACNVTQIDLPQRLEPIRDNIIRIDEKIIELIPYFLSTRFLGIDNTYTGIEPKVETLINWPDQHYIAQYKTPWLWISPVTFLNESELKNWIYQRYLILNNLRYLNAKTFACEPIDAVFKTGITSFSYQTAESAIDAAISAATNTAHEHYTNATFFSKQTGLYKGQAQSCSFKAKITDFSTDCAIPFDFDFYLFVSFSVLTYNYQFFSDRYVNYFNIVKNYASGDTIINTNTGDLSDIDFFPKYPTETSDRCAIGQFINPTYSLSIVKPVFQFKDW